jgi:hypothetical protein
VTAIVGLGIPALKTYYSVMTRAVSATVESYRGCTARLKINSEGNAGGRIFKAE